MSKRKSYLGDGVYVDVVNDGISDSLVLTTENGVETTNTIWLDGDVYAALERYVRRLYPAKEKP